MIDDLPNWNWFAYPADFTIAAVADKVIAWLLAGVALAAIVRPKPSAAVPVAA